MVGNSEPVQKDTQHVLVPGLVQHAEAAPLTKVAEVPKRDVLAAQLAVQDHRQLL